MILVNAVDRQNRSMQNRSLEVSKVDVPDLPRVFDVWLASVRATHTFLSEADIQSLIPVVKEGLSHFGPIHCLRDHAGEVFAFLGVDQSKVEMLFVHPESRGTGAGRALMAYAVRVLGATSVDVNEQNPQAIGFYQHIGFEQIGRSPLDSSGNPFPIVHMQLRSDRTALPRQ